jgi:hypothetical protein
MACCISGPDTSGTITAMQLQPIISSRPVPAAFPPAQLAAVTGAEPALPAAPGFVPELPQQTRSELMQRAAARPDLRWDLSRGWKDARNAHFTNTVDELRLALNSEANYLEGDIRSINGVPVMRHGLLDRVDLTLADWLEIGAASGRGVKMDIKERGLIMTSVEMARRAGIPGDRLIVNVSASVDPTTLVGIRRFYPTATVNLSPDGPLGREQLLKLQQSARLTGGPVMFPLRVDRVTQTVIDALRPFGAVAIWNDPDIPGVDDIPGLTARLRGMGVTGMIDLRRSTRAA